MKKVLCCIVLLVCLIPINVDAQQGCCSRHGGVAGCSDGRQLCNDGTLSPSCTCSGSTSSSNSSSGGNSSSSSNSSSSNTVVQPTYIYGCTDKNALNYNASATKDDGSCIQKVEGCMDISAKNYNSTANVSDGTCQFEKEITEIKKINYEVEYVDNDEMLVDEEKVKTKGVKGEKEVTYLVLLDEKGIELSREEKSTNIIKEPINQVVERGTKEQSSAFGLVWFLFLIISFIYAFTHKDGNLLLNKISHHTLLVKIILYFLYVTCIIPPFIDIVLIVISMIKKSSNKTV